MILANRLRMMKPIPGLPDPNFPYTSDPYWNNVVLLLRGDGANGSTSIVDSSGNAYSVTTIGTVTISTAQNPSGSIQFGSGAFFYVGMASEPLWADGFAYTFEATIFMSAYGGITHFMSQGANNNNIFGVFSDGRLFRYNHSGAMVLTTNTVPLNRFVHIACTSDGTIMKMFIDGIQGYSGADVGVPCAGCNTHFGAGYVGGWNSHFPGLANELRITKGVARYTADFTPPTGPFPNTGP